MILPLVRKEMITKSREINNGIKLCPLASRVKLILPRLTRWWRRGIINRLSVHLYPERNHGAWHTLAVLLHF